EQTISVVGPIVAAIIVLSIFFKLLGWISRRSADSIRRIAFEGILDDKTPATVHLTTGATLVQVRFIGVIDSGSFKGPVPYKLRGMMIFEHSDGRRTI